MVRPGDHGFGAGVCTASARPLQQPPLVRVRQGSTGAGLLRLACSGIYPAAISGNIGTPNTASALNARFVHEQQIRQTKRH